MRESGSHEQKGRQRRAENRIPAVKPILRRKPGRPRRMKRVVDDIKEQLEEKEAETKTARPLRHFRRCICAHLADHPRCHYVFARRLFFFFFELAFGRGLNL